MKVGQIFGNMATRMKLRSLTNKYQRQIKALDGLDMPETKALVKKVAGNYATEYKEIINGVDPLKVTEAWAEAAPKKKAAPAKKKAAPKKKAAAKGKGTAKGKADGEASGKSDLAELG